MFSIFRRSVKKIVSDVVLIIDIIGIVFSVCLLVRSLLYYTGALDGQWVFAFLVDLIILINFIDNLLHDWRRNDKKDTDDILLQDSRDCPYRVEDKDGFYECHNPQASYVEYCCAGKHYEGCLYHQGDVDKWKQKN